jgi:uncharacterized damage-inducible protein DinB
MRVDTLWSTALWQQFGAAIDTLENALLACPASLWNEPLWGGSSAPPVPVEFSEFWNISYHTLFWLDLYLSGSLDGFVPPAPFTLQDPDRTYTKDELQVYLRHTRAKCRSTLAALTPETASQICEFPWVPGRTFTFAELLLYTMRHVQEHSAQLHLFLGQHGHAAATSWISRVRSDQMNLGGD